jgi:hypothetical protein
MEEQCYTGQYHIDKKKKKKKKKMQHQFKTPK